MSGMAEEILTGIGQEMAGTGIVTRTIDIATTAADIKPMIGTEIQVATVTVRPVIDTETEMSVTTTAVIGIGTVMSATVRLVRDTEMAVSGCVKMLTTHEIEITRTRSMVAGNDSHTTLAEVQHRCCN